ASVRAGGLVGAHAGSARPRAQLLAGGEAAGCATQANDRRRSSRPGAGGTRDRRRARGRSRGRGQRASGARGLPRGAVVRDTTGGARAGAAATAASDTRPARTFQIVELLGNLRSGGRDATSRSCARVRWTLSCG